MTGIDSYSITPATNATADGGSINWAEGQPPSSVNNTARQMLADTRTSYNDLIWFQYGTGDQGAGNLAVPSVYASGTSFTITGADVTLVYTANRRVRAVGVSTGTIYGTIASSSYNSGNTKTTVVVVWDSGSLSNETLTISLSQIPATGSPLTSSAISNFQSSGTFSIADSSGASLTVTTTYGTYVVTGKMCHVEFKFAFQNNASGTTFKISGFPFAFVNLITAPAMCTNGNQAILFADTTTTMMAQNGASGEWSNSSMSSGTTQFVLANFTYQIA